MVPDTCNNSFFRSVIACATHASIGYFKNIPKTFENAVNKQNGNGNVGAMYQVES